MLRHLFQRKIPKIADVRVTLVNHKAFCVRIDSVDGLLDWRADYGQLRYSVIPAPVGILAALEKFLEAFGLVFGCFDFAIDQDGDWIWLEFTDRSVGSPGRSAKAPHAA